MGSSGALAAIWRFMILFVVVWIVLFATEPDFVKDKETGELSKQMITWWSIGLSLVFAFIFWALHYQSLTKATQHMLGEKQM
jgi:hypothetical protein